MDWRNNATGHLFPPVWSILGWNCLCFCVQTSRSDFRWPFSKLNDIAYPAVSFRDVPAFHGNQIVGSVATTLYESRILEFYHLVSRSSREFLPSLRTAVELCLGACRGQPSNAVSLFRPVLVWRNWILCRKQWIGYNLCFSSVCQMQVNCFQAFWFVILTMFVFKFSIESLKQSVEPRGS